MQYIKLNNTITKPYVLLQNAIIKNKRNYIKNDSDQSIPNIHLADWNVVYLRLKEQTKELCATFYCRTEPLNLSDFIMNLIEDLNMLQFCWSLNLLLP